MSVSAAVATDRLRWARFGKASLAGGWWQVLVQLAVAGDWVLRMPGKSPAEECEERSCSPALLGQVVNTLCQSGLCQSGLFRTRLF